MTNVNYKTKAMIQNIKTGTTLLIEDTENNSYILTYGIQDGSYDLYGWLVYGDNQKLYGKKTKWGFNCCNGNQLRGKILEDLEDGLIQRMSVITAPSGGHKN